MKRRILTTAFVSALVVALFQSVGAEPPAVSRPEEKSVAPPVTDWKEDPVCRMVFFAVLEGLYADGVPNEVVDSIVPRKPTRGDNPVKTSFVVQCPLCHPVYEAFTQYQRRQAFRGDESKRDTFGKGLEPELVRSLKSENTQTRLTALRGLVHRWVERRLAMMRLSEAEMKDWTTKLNERSTQGRKTLSNLIQADPDYKGWSIYWGCAACNGSTDACKSVRSEQKPK
jgi:hypothetical protein